MITINEVIDLREALIDYGGYWRLVVWDRTNNKKYRILKVYKKFDVVRLEIETLPENDPPQPSLIQIDDQGGLE